jgi:hypothetical protein
MYLVKMDFQVDGSFLSKNPIYEVCFFVAAGGECGEPIAKGSQADFHGSIRSRHRYKSQRFVQQNEFNGEQGGVHFHFGLCQSDRPELSTCVHARQSLEIGSEPQLWVWVSASRVTPPSSASGSGVEQMPWYTWEGKVPPISFKTQPLRRKEMVAEAEVELNHKIQ